MFAYNYFPYFQPIIEIASGKIAGYEALARTKNENNIAISAGSLFTDPGIQASTKLAIDRCLRNQAIEYFSKHKNAGFLSLNISPDWVDLLDKNNTIPTIGMIDKLSIDPSRILIEITERTGTIGNLRRLTEEYQRLGLQVAIDDFGAGASQVDRIIELEPDYIKIDMKLFKSAAKGGTAANVLLSITLIAQRAGCKIICEGIETKEEFFFAIDCGADYIQGWLFKEAIPEVIADDSFSSKVSHLKRLYLEKKSQRLKNSVDHNKTVSMSVIDLNNYLRTIGTTPEDIQKFQFFKMSRLNIVRFYICDSQGTQISVNYELKQNNIVMVDTYLKYNWCHRPYFPLLIAIQGFYDDHVIVSEPYKDINSEAMCKTYCLFISSCQILLVDVLVNEDILFITDS